MNNPGRSKTTEAKSGSDAPARNFEPPAATTLATLAAVLGPKENPQSAFENALRWWYEAKTFESELKQLTEDEAFLKYAPERAAKESFLSMGFRFYPDKDGEDADEFRKYLCHNGIPYVPAKADSVLRIISQFFSAVSKDQEKGKQEFERFKAIQKRTDESGKDYILVHQSEAERILAWKKSLKRKPRTSGKS